MMDQLDLLLERTREPEPADGLFVARVINAVRTEPARTPKRRRYLARPFLLAGAAVLACGGTVAAVVSTQQPHHVKPKPSNAVSVEAPALRRATAPAATQPGSRVQAGATSPVKETRQIFRRDDFEWGYLTSHSSYVLDRSTGLRLETDAKDNVFSVGKVHRVTVTLANTSKTPISLEVSKACALQVMGFSGRTPPSDPSGFHPDGTRDPARASAYACAGSAKDPGSDRSTETIVLAPGAQRSGTAMVRFDRSVPATVLGVCSCAYVDPSQPNPRLIPPDIGQLSRVATTTAVFPPANPLTEPLVTSEVDGTFTPPIGLRPV